jgi:hypothetical protein
MATCILTYNPGFEFAQMHAGDPPMCEDNYDAWIRRRSLLMDLYNKHDGNQEAALKEYNER